MDSVHWTVSPRASDPHTNRAVQYLSCLAFPVLLELQKRWPSSVALVQVACSVSEQAFEGQRLVSSSSTCSTCLPACFPDTGDETVAGQVAETDTANAELAIHGAGPTAQHTAALHANPFA